MDPTRALVSMMSLVLASCSCASEAPGVDSSEPDLGLLVLPDASSPTQPCLDGIRRDAVALPPIMNEDLDWLTALRAEGDVVLVARTDVAETDMPVHRTRGLFARVDAHDATVLASGFADLPFLTGQQVPPIAIRVLDDGSTEVLFVRSTDFVGAVAHFDTNAAPLGVQVISSPGNVLGNDVAIAMATDRGFLVAGEATLITVENGVARPTGLGFPARGRFPQYQFSMDGDTSGRVWMAFGHDGGVTVARLDASDPSQFVDTVEVPELDQGGTTISVTPDGALLSVFGFDSQVLQLRWLDDQLDVVGTGAQASFLANVLGVAGAFPREGLVFVQNGGLSFGLAAAPGAIEGGVLRLVAGIDSAQGGTFLRGTRLVTARSDGAFTVATWQGSLTLVTFCAGGS